MSLRDAWDDNAEAWLQWARRPGHDTYYLFNGARFMDLVPPAGRLTVDLGGGEGRLGRDLGARGHKVISLDASFTLTRACATHELALPAVVADVAAVPLFSKCADLVVAFMSLQDVDDLASAVAEAARLLAPNGAFCMAVVHPVNSAGQFEGARDNPHAPFVISGSYMDSHRYRDDVERDGISMTFHSEHRPLETYFTELETNGFVVESVREVTVPDRDDRWSRIPGFLHLRARRS